MIPKKLLKGFHHHAYTWTLTFAFNVPATLNKAFQWHADSYLVVENFVMAADNRSNANYARLDADTNYLFNIRREASQYNVFSSDIPYGMISASPASGFFHLPVPLIVKPREILQFSMNFLQPDPILQQAFALDMVGIRVYE